LFQDKKVCGVWGKAPWNNKLFDEKKSSFQNKCNIYSHIPAGSQVFSRKPDWRVKTAWWMCQYVGNILFCRSEWMKSLNVQSATE